MSETRSADDVMKCFVVDNTLLRPPQSATGAMERLLPTTMLLKHLEHVPLSEWSPRVKYLGVGFFEEDGEEFAVGRLLATLDQALFFGNSRFNPLAFDGLVNAPGISHYSYTAHEEFYEAQSKRPGFRIFETTQAVFCAEGYPPTPATEDVVVALRLDAVRWRQLLPCVVIPLIPHAPVDRRRSAAFIYGYLEILDPSGILVLHGAGDRG